MRFVSICFSPLSKWIVLRARHFCQLSPMHLRPMPEAWATTQTLLRSWAMPAWKAENTPHPASYPVAARSRRTRPKNRPCSLDSSPGTFSATTHLGLTSQMTLANSPHRSRSSADARRFPARLCGWHGKPPEITVISGPHFSATCNPVTFRISLHLGTSGQCFSSTFVG